MAAFDLPLCAGFATAAVGSVAAAIYLCDIFRGGTKPNRATWWILTAIGALIASSHYASGGKQTMWLAGIYVVIPLAVALASIRRGEGGCSRFDRSCIIGAGLSFALWLILQEAVVALTLNLLIDFLALLPTIRKAYRRPEQENRLAWALAFAASAISLFAVSPWTFAVAIYPIYMAAVNGLVAGILWRYPFGLRPPSIRNTTFIVLCCLTRGIEDASADEKEAVFSSQEFVETKEEENKWTGDTGTNFVTTYFAYGILAENQGLIAQPYLDLYYTLYRGDGLLTKVSTGLQLWSSIHSEETDSKAGRPLSAWYENDYYWPLTITLGKRLSIAVSYFQYDFPNGAYETLKGINANISFDDSDMFGCFALHPHMMVLYNFDGILGLGRTAAWYGEAGVAPAFIFAKSSKYPITLSFPLTAGFGDQRFYPEDHLGFVSAGFNIAMPLKWISSSSRMWNVNTGVVQMRLGGATAELNANRKRNASVWQVGLGVSF